MLTVVDYELIRRKHFVDRLSGRAIAKERGHSRKTVAKALANAVPPGYRLSEPRLRPAIERYRPIIDAWLEEDRSRPRKQRHTAQRIYERLRDEHEYPGSPSSVRRYVASRKTGQGEVFMPLYFAPGEEAQVDWGEATVIENGVQRKVPLFCMKLCHSHAVFVRAYERANLESFLDGHVRAFAFFGGVPKRIAYDNLKSAVVYVGRGRERRLGPPSLRAQGIRGSCGDLLRARVRGSASAELCPGAIRAPAAALSAALGAETGLFGPGEAVSGRSLGRGFRPAASGTGVPRPMPRMRSFWSVWQNGNWLAARPKPPSGACVRQASLPPRIWPTSTSPPCPS